MISEAIHEREYYIAKVYLKLGLYDELKLRWEQIGYSPKPIQLKLNF